MQSGVRGLVGYGRFWLCGGGRAWGGWRGLSDMIPDVGPGDGERRRRVIHSEQRWPPLKRTFNKPKPWNIEAREKKRTAKYNARRKQVDKEMENYTPPSLLETIEKSKALRYEWKLSNRLRLSSIKGTGPNTGEMEEGTASDVYTEHTEDSLGVDPAGPNTMFAVFIIGARQVRAVKGDIIYSEKIPFRINEKIRLSKVLLCATRYWSVIGRPLVHNASVRVFTAETHRTVRQGLGQHVRLVTIAVMFSFSLSFSSSVSDVSLLTLGRRDGGGAVKDQTNQANV